MTEDYTMLGIQCLDQPIVQSFHKYRVSIHVTYARSFQTIIKVDRRTEQYLDDEMAEETSMAHTSAKSNDEVLQKFILYFEENTKARD